MKYKLLPLLLAVITGAAALSACDTDKLAATADEAVNLVYPEGEGHFYDPSAVKTEPSTSAEPDDTTPVPAAPKKKKKPAATEATTEGTQPTTVNYTVPTDNITEDNINPHLSSIQQKVAALIRAQQLKSLSLSEKQLTMEVGESKTLTVRFDPEDALIKVFTLSTSAANVTASKAENTITVAGKKAGKCTLTVTSYDKKHKATCEITVKAKSAPTPAPTQRVITDDTALSHKELCTAANAARWCDAVKKRLQQLGIQYDPTLSGDGTALSTADLSGSISYNQAEKQLVSYAESAMSAQTNGQWDSFAFNCTSAVRGGECTIVINMKDKEPSLE